jgi:hypothetical protein
MEIANFTLTKMQFRRKIPSFVFGVSIGLIIGIGFFIFKLDDYFNKIKTASTKEIKIIEQPVIQEKKAETKEDKERYKINTKVSPYTNYKEVDSMIRSEDNEINLAKEEFISVKNIKLIDLDVTQKDTMAAKLAGVNRNENASLFFVEFWKTPLNSKGYRMTRNRIILYGFSDFSSLNLYKVDEVYYLKSEDQVYKVSPNADFMPMDRVNDADLLAKIN